MRGFLFAAVKDRLGLDADPDVVDGSDPGIPWPLFHAPQRLPRIVIQPMHQVAGMAQFRKRGEDSEEIDLSKGPQVLEVPYGYYALTLPDGTEKTVIAAWEEKIVEV